MRRVCAAAGAVLLLAGRAAALDDALYARLLEQHTVAVEDVASTRVDYRALRESADWRALVRSLRESDPRRLGDRAEELAFWINAYNILAIELVQRSYPTDSIRSLGGLFSPVWGKPAGRIGDRTVTLDEIEHRILRPLGEPRIHGAIVCASLACPPLRREPYRAADLDAQLDDNVRRWLADSRKGLRIDRASLTVLLSPIFDWFAADFGADVLAFVAAHAPEESAAWIRAHRGALELRYFEYDWRLNDTAKTRR